MKRTGTERYEIRVQGRLDSHWSDWFEGLALTPLENGETRISGPVRDQAALFGILAKIRDLGLHLDSLVCKERSIEMDQVRVDETENVRKLVDQWVDALLDGDMERLSQMTADGFVTIGPRGFVLDKEQWLSGFKTGGLQYEKIDWGEISVQTFGNAAIVTGHDQHRVKAQGRTMEFDLRAMLAFARQDGRWQLISQQYSPIIPAP